MLTEVNQIFASGKNPGNEIHNGAAYWVIGTRSFDKTGPFTMTNQGYVSAAHEDMEMPSIAAEGTGGNDKAIMLFTLSGNGGPTGADKGGFYPSTAYGRLTATSHGLTGSAMNIADAGKSPQDGFSEYQPGPDGNPAPLGRLQLGDLPAGRQRSVVLRHRVHPVPQLHGQGVHADHRNLRWDPGRPRQLGNLCQLRRAVGL